MVAATRRSVIFTAIETIGCLHNARHTQPSIILEQRSIFVTDDGLPFVTVDYFRATVDSKRSAFWITVDHFRTTIGRLHNDRLFRMTIGKFLYFCRFWRSITFVPLLLCPFLVFDRLQLGSSNSYTHCIYLLRFKV